MKDLEGRLADATGLSSATPIEPVPVSPLCASIPSAVQQVYARPAVSVGRCITAGRLYLVCEEPSYGGFYILDDVNDRIYCLWEECAFQDGGDWQKVVCDSDGNPKGGDGTAPSQSDDSAGLQGIAHPQPVGSETATDAAKREGEE